MKPKITNNLNTFKVPKSILLTGKALQAIHTDLATKFAARIFGTPLKFKIPERELMMRNSTKNELFEIKDIDKKVMVYRYGFSKKKILIVHGWSGRGTQLYQLADKILENKMMVISFDGPSHGLSSGKTTLISEFVETIHQINKEYGPFDAAIGHSFGAMSLLNAVADGLDIKKLVLIGADNSIREITQQFVKKIELKPIIAKKLETLFYNKYKVNIEEYSSYKAASKVKIPTLVIHDSEDKFVPVSSAIAIRQSLKNGELLITNGLGHHKIFKNSTVIQRIIDFIQ
jgi:pimeloyl-ACP methyl ester carboxylesterase